MARLWRPVLLADAAACSCMLLHAAACSRVPATPERQMALSNGRFWTLWWQVGEAVEACATGRMLQHAAACSCMLLHAAACSRVPATPERQMALSNGRFWTLWWQVGEAVEACATGGCCCMLPHAAACCCMLLHAAACQRHPRGRWRCPMAGFGRVGGRLARLWRPVLLADAAACCRMQLHAAACCCMQPRASDTREADGAVQWQVFGRFGGRLARLWRPVLLADAAACCRMQLHAAASAAAAACQRHPRGRWRCPMAGFGRFGGQVGEAVEDCATGGCCCMLPHATACCCMLLHAAACQRHPRGRWRCPMAGLGRFGGRLARLWRPALLADAAACCRMQLHAAACSRVPATPERQMALSNGRFWTLWWQVGEAVEACATGGCCCMLPHAAACCCMLLHAAACQRHPRGRWRCPMAGFGRFGGRLARLWRPVPLADAAACCRMQLHAAACCCMQPRASDTREADAGTRLHAAACSSMQLHAAACSSIRQ